VVQQKGGQFPVGEPPAREGGNQYYPFRFYFQALKDLNFAMKWRLIAFLVVAFPKSKNGDMRKKEIGGGLLPFMVCSWEIEIEWPT
jgi:hypothetical protein